MTRDTLSKGSWIAAGAVTLSLNYVGVVTGTIVSTVTLITLAGVVQLLGTMYWPLRQEEVKP